MNYRISLNGWNGYVACEFSVHIHTSSPQSIRRGMEIETQQFTTCSREDGSQRSKRMRTTNRQSGSGTPPPQSYHITIIIILLFSSEARKRARNLIDFGSLRRWAHSLNGLCAARSFQNKWRQLTTPHTQETVREKKSGVRVYVCEKVQAVSVCVSSIRHVCSEEYGFSESFADYGKDARGKVGGRAGGGGGGRNGREGG